VWYNLSKELSFTKEDINLHKAAITFEKYLEDNYGDIMMRKIKSFVYENRASLGLETDYIPEPSYHKVEEYDILGVTFQNNPEDEQKEKFLFKVTCKVYINIKGRTRYRDYDEQSVYCWLSISFSASLKEKLTGVKITDVDEYSKQRFDSENALTRYLVPYIYSKDLDKHAEDFLKNYYPKALKEPMKLPVEEVVKNMGLSLYYAPLPDDIFGRTYFADVEDEVYDEHNTLVKQVIKSGTILINRDVSFMRNVGSLNNTIIHECVHWEKHFKFFRLQHILNPDYAAVSCTVLDKYIENNSLSKELDWMEWQANAIAPKILMPAEPTKAKFKSIVEELKINFPNLSKRQILEEAVGHLANFFGVSNIAAKIRALELGFKQVYGTFNYIDDERYPPFSYKDKTLRNGQTFVLDFIGGLVTCLSNPTLMEAVTSGKIVYASGFFCINNPDYVKAGPDGVFRLTDYALGHVDECCLIFNTEQRINRSYDASYYSLCFLCRNANSSRFIETICSMNEEQNEDVLKNAAAMGRIAKMSKEYAEIGASLPSSFSGTLDAHIKRRGYTNEQMEERTLISERTIREYRNNIEVKPTLQSVLALCIGLNLQPQFAFDLLDKAGHNINSFVGMNFIYSYLIYNHHMENIYLWNEKLSKGNMDPLPSKRKS